jgi:hypothetical protein
MIGVDLKGQLLLSCLIERRQMNKWYAKLFHRFLNTSILNVIIYKNNCGKWIDQLSFRIKLVEGLCTKYANTVECKVLRRCSSDSTVLCIMVRHFISKIQPTEKKSRPQRWCAVCQKQGKRKDIVHWHDACDAGLVQGMFSQMPHQAQFLRQYNTIIHNFYKLTVPKIILKRCGLILHFCVLLWT